MMNGFNLHSQGHIHLCCMSAEEQDSFWVYANHESKSASIVVCLFSVSSSISLHSESKWSGKKVKQEHNLVTLCVVPESNIESFSVPWSQQMK